MLNPTEINTLQRLLKGDDARLPVVFDALSDPRRCKIFRGFLARERLCVSDIAKTFSISMSLASQHLKTLEQAGLLTREREGRVIYYRPNTADKLVRSIITAVS